MKKLFSLAVIFSLLLSFSACSDNESIATNGNGNKGVAQDTADYTVIFYAMMGNLDEQVVPDLADLVMKHEKGLIGDNVNFAGIIKTSNYSRVTGDSLIQQELAQYNLDGTLYVDLGEKSGANISIDSTANFEEMVATYKALHAKKYASSYFPMNNPDSIASVIKMVAAKHPAKHYVLMTLGHGTGYLPCEETPNADAYQTRAVVTDCFNKDALNNDRGITLDDYVAGINKSGIHIQTLFFQNCEMATLENLAGWQHCADYAIASVEPTFSNYLQQYVENISKAGDDLEKMKQASRDLVDHYVKTVTEDGPEEYTSHGFYDLSKVGSLLNTVRDISAWYSDAADKDEDFVNYAVASTQQVSDVNLDDYLVFIYKHLRNTTNTDEENKKLIEAICKVCTTPIYNTFILSHMMYVSLNDGRAVATAKLDFDALSALYNQYLTQLKDMAYIRSTHENNSVTDYNYIHTSPGVNIIALNQEHYKLPGVWTMSDKDEILTAVLKFIDALKNGDDVEAEKMYDELFDGYALVNPADESTSLKNVLYNYQSSQFDQATKWSSFLQKITHTPNYLTNPVRRILAK